MADRLILRGGAGINPPGYMRPGELGFAPADNSLWLGGANGTSQRVSGGGSAALTAAAIIAALGYFPYDAANQGGYITSSALAPYTLTSSLAAVATSGAYASLSGKPVLFSGAYADLTGTPTIPTVSMAGVSGAYADLTGKPALFSGAYADLSGKPTIPTVSAAGVSGAYADLTGKPALFSGAYADLTGKPTIPTVSAAGVSGAYADLSGKPALFSGAYADLSGKPTIPTVSAAGVSGVYADLTGKPTIPTVSAAGVSGAYADLTGKPTLFSGAYADLSGKPALATVATSGLYTDLASRPSLATVATSGLYTDLTSRPALSAVATSGAYADLTGAPTQSTVASSGAYADLTGKPTIPVAGTAAPAMDGATATAGTSSAFAPIDHVHPKDSTKAPLASPVFTGTVVVPTPAVNDNSTKAASTAFVANSFAPLSGASFSGPVIVATQAAGDSSTKAATTAFVATSFAPLASPVFTGNQTQAAAGSTSTRLRVTDAGTDLQYSDIYATSAGVSFRLLNDAFTTGNAYLSVARTTNAATTLTLTAGTINLNGSVALSQPLSAAQGGTGDTGGAWAVSTPAVGASSGALTTASATLRMKKIGRSALVNLAVTVTTNGTAAGALTVTLPFTAAVLSVLAGRETSSTGKALQAFVSAGSNTLSIINYDNSYPAANGTLLVLSGVVEATA